MWRRAVDTFKKRVTVGTSQSYCVLARRRFVEDEGDWSYSSEWWDHSNSRGQVVYCSTSGHGNGVVTVNSYPSSRPRMDVWPETERWLASRNVGNDRFRVSGYQWRTLRFNNETRQSTAKVMVACMESQPSADLKSMVSLGLATIASCNYDLMLAAYGKKTMRILCIGHGGGALPLFLASKIPGAVLDIVEIDPLVIDASIHAMGFPSYSVVSPYQRAFIKPNFVSDILWKGIHERLYLYESDAECFILKTSDLYDLVFIDAYDGDDIFPRKLWDPDAPFLKALGDKLHPEHGTVVVNLHSDDDDASPMGSYVNTVSRAYKDMIVPSCMSESGQDSGAAFTVSAPWICNTALAVCRGKLDAPKGSILYPIASKSFEVERLLNLPFPCFDYIKNGFKVVD